MLFASACTNSSPTRRLVSFAAHGHDEPTHEQLANQQVADAIEKQGPNDLQKLMYSGMVWEVGADGSHHEPS